MTGSDTQVVENKKSGRVDVGSVYVCAHGEEKVVHAIVDWRPFEYYTYESPMGPGLSGIITIRFIPIEGGTRVIGIGGQPQGPFIARKMAKLFRRKALKQIEQLGDDFREVVMRELESGTTVRPEASSVPADQVTAAARTSLAETGAD